MGPVEFIKELKALGWNIEDSGKDDIIEIDLLADGRFVNAPSELAEFIGQFSLCASKDDTIWFLSINDYLEETDSDFSWDEFEQQSLDSAVDEDVEEIEKFWNSNLPFLMAVKNGYGYAAVVLDGENKGSVVLGNEPEFEDTVTIANSINEFFDIYISVLKNEIQNPAFSFIK